MPMRQGLVILFIATPLAADTAAVAVATSAGRRGLTDATETATAFMAGLVAAYNTGSVAAIAPYFSPDYISGDPNGNGSDDYVQASQLVVGFMNNPIMVCIPASNQSASRGYTPICHTRSLRSASRSSRAQAYPTKDGFVGFTAHSAVLVDGKITIFAEYNFEGYPPWYCWQVLRCRVACGPGTRAR